MMDITQIMIGIPTRGSPRRELVEEIQNWREAHHGLRRIQYGVSGMTVCEARNQIRKAFLASGCQMLLMIDDDVIPRDESALNMARRGLDVVGAPVLIQKAEANLPFPVVYRYDKEQDGYWPIDDCYSRSGLIQCDAVGFGAVALSRRAVLDCGPFFHTFDADGLLYRTEDMTFCERARELGYSIWSDYDVFADHCPTVNLTELQRANMAATEKALGLTA